MKFTVTMKDPDGIWDSTREFCDEAVKGLPLTESERDKIREKRLEDLDQYLKDNWFEYGEYVEIEIDTDANTATVVPQSETLSVLDWTPA